MSGKTESLTRLRGGGESLLSTAGAAWRVMRSLGPAALKATVVWTILAQSRHAEGGPCLVASASRKDSRTRSFLSVGDDVRGGRRWVEDFSRLTGRWALGAVRKALGALSPDWARHV